MISLENMLATMSAKGLVTITAMAAGKKRVGTLVEFSYGSGQVTRAWANGLGEAVTKAYFRSVDRGVFA